MAIEFHKAKLSTRLNLTLLLAIISFGMALFISFSGYFSVFELKIFDLLSLYASEKNTSDDIVIVRVDQFSINAFEKELKLSWPWQRDIYEPILDKLSEANAVFIDVLFTEPSIHAKSNDDIFADAAGRAGNVHIAHALTNSNKGIDPALKNFLKKISAPENIPTSSSFKSILPPIEELRAKIKGSGNVTIRSDEDGIYRRMPLFFDLGPYRIPHLIMSYFLKEDLIQTTPEGILLDKETIPLMGEKLLLKFDGRKKPFQYVSFVDVFNAYVDPDNSKLPKDFFKGKYVFIGYTAKGLYDLRPTPVSSASPGVFVLATAFENLIHGNYLKIVGKKTLLFIMLVTCLLTTLIVLASIRLFINLAFLLISISFFSILTILLFKNGIYMQSLGPFSAMFLSYLFALIYSYSSEGRQRAFVRATFSQYMDKKIVDHILENPDLIAPGGHRIRGTVFFTDIAGFTTISERISAEETATMLYHVLTVMSDIIIRSQGIIDKYIGDSIMAFWGAPAATDSDETNACKAALACADALHRVNKSFKENVPHIGMRFGIHSGELIVGNLGSEQLFDYTVIGDTVNLASRLESVNKFFGTTIIISESTLEKTEDIFITKCLGDIAVKGKSEPIRIYELVGEKGKIDKKRQENIDLFEKGVTLFYEQKFANAFEIFYNAQQTYGKDGPTELYLNRCKTFIESPPVNENWHIIKMKEK